MQVILNLEESNCLIPPGSIERRFVRGTGDRGRWTSSKSSRPHSHWTKRNWITARSCDSRWPSSRLKRLCKTPAKVSMATMGKQIRVHLGRRVVPVKVTSACRGIMSSVVVRQRDSSSLCVQHPAGRRRLLYST